MKSINFVIYISFGIIAISGCGQKDSELSAFKKGEVIAWTLIGKDGHSKDLEQEQDCAKIFSKTNGIIHIFQSENSLLYQNTFWGGETSDEKKTDSIIALPDGGDLTTFTTESSALDNAELVITAKRPDNAVVRFFYTTNKDKVNSIIWKNWDYVNPTEQQARHHTQAIKFLKPTSYYLCTAESYKKYMDTIKQKNNGNLAKIDNALKYVLDKKWSLDNVNCEYNGGTYQIYSKSFPSGNAFFVAGKAQVSNNPQEYEFIDNGQNNFTHIMRIAVGNNKLFRIDDPLQLSMEKTTNVTLTSPGRIDYKSHIRSLNFDAATQGLIKYDSKEEQGFGLLCN